MLFFSIFLFFSCSYGRSNRDSFTFDDTFYSVLKQVSSMKLIANLDNVNITSEFVKFIKQIIVAGVLELIYFH